MSPGGPTRPVHEPATITPCYGPSSNSRLRGDAGARTALAGLIRDAGDPLERKQAIAMYRRAAATLCDGVA
ncbi:hypothetical protein ABZW03_40810, partial [Kitasatospora sp. NPDC004799]|uniref:hypothetical protein n=1 Tax=Kitasatospora sp. NPDC004799 TaxID=3154460 RepID=UPI0033B790C0